MKHLAIFATLLLVGTVSSAPTTNTTDDDETLEFTKELLIKDLIIYSAEHDIVSILTPLNALNFEDDDDGEDSSDDLGSVLFFVLADNQDGKRIDQGLFVRRKGVITKLLDNGREAAADNEDTKLVYLGAQDGIYTYNNMENKADKYGTITDSVISIAKVNSSDIIYILTEDKSLYKVTEQATQKEKIENVVNAQKIVLDLENNLYYLTEDKQVYVLGSDDVKKVEGLPESPAYTEIIRPPFVLDVGVPVIFDNQVYVAYPNGTSETIDIQFTLKPSAYSVEATLIQYYAYEKKIYEYNILALLSAVLAAELSDVKNFLDSKADTINELATRSRTDLVL